MRIAQVAPLYESVPPKYYGGTERVVSYLTEELVRQGHEVTLFASGDSETNARLVAACQRSLRLDKRYQDQMAHHFVMLERVFQRAGEFDIIHFHVDYLHFPFSRREAFTHVTNQGERRAQLAAIARGEPPPDGVRWVLAEAAMPLDNPYLEPVARCRTSGEQLTLYRAGG